MTYQPMRFARWLFLVVFAAFGAAAVGLVVAVVRGDGPPLWFAVLWLAGVAWNAYWWLGRTCVQVQVDGPTLTWRTPLTGGSADLHDVVRIRSSRTSRQLAVIELRTHRPLLVPVRYGFGGLERAIAAGSPALDLDAA